MIDRESITLTLDVGSDTAEFAIRLEDQSRSLRGGPGGRSFGLVQPLALRHASPDLGDGIVGQGRPEQGLQPRPLERALRVEPLRSARDPAPLSGVRCEIAFRIRDRSFAGRDGLDRVVATALGHGDDALGPFEVAVRGRGRGRLEGEPADGTRIADHQARRDGGDEVRMAGPLQLGLGVSEFLLYGGDEHMV